MVSFCDVGAAGSCHPGGAANADHRAGKKSAADERGIRLSVCELRRVICALREPEEQRVKRLWWSHFRRVHQAGARRCHVQRRARQAPLTCTEPRPPIRLMGLPDLTADHWERLRPLLPQPRSGHSAEEGRLIVEAILWVMQTGSAWREVPERFG